MMRNIGEFTIVTDYFDHHAMKFSYTSQCEFPGLARNEPKP